MNHKFWKPFIMSGCIIATMAFAMESPASAQGNGGAELSKLADSNAVKLEQQVKQMDVQNALHAKANVAYSKLQNVLSEHKNVKNSYAGAYINDNNELVINLTSSDKKVQDEIVDETGSQKVAFQQMKYSYQELNDTFENLKTILSDSKYTDKVNCYYVDEKNNVVVIETTDMSLEDFLKEQAVNSDCIKVTETKHKIAAQKTYLKPGGFIGFEEGNAETCYSIGWRAWRINNAGNKTYGLVTAGHGVINHKTALTYGGGEYGKFVLKRFGGKMDMSFVQRTNDNYGETNTIKFSGSSLKAGYYVRSSYMKTGDNVYKAGMTTGLTTGKIISTSAAVSYDGKNFTNFVLTDNYCQSGDSGGIAYMNIDGAYRIMGNTAAGWEDNKPNASNTWFAKAEPVIEDEDIMPY